MSTDGITDNQQARVRQRWFIWNLAPGFTIIDAHAAFAAFGVGALKKFPHKISTRPRKGWRCVRFTLQVQRQNPRAVYD